MTTKLPNSVSRNPRRKLLNKSSPNAFRNLNQFVLLSNSEVEKFVAANTQELAKDKWLCPLSGKKFKGPDFVRKHIFNKHGEKVDEVRKDVEYFNNYLRDPKRPQLPENPGNRSAGTRPSPASAEPPRENFGAPGGGYG